MIRPLAAIVAVLLMISLICPVRAAENLAANPSFEQDRESNGMPDGWQTSGDAKLVTQTLALDHGRAGPDGTQPVGRAARLQCTRFEAGNPAAHAMVCQMGIPVVQGKSYRVSLWARGENILADTVSVALSDTAGWHSCGLQDSLLPTADWVRYEFNFRATRDCGKSSRFQIWFTSTGTLWLDDLVFEETSGDALRPGHVVPAAGHKNLVPSSSFECGSDGWGSAEWELRKHWGGPLNTRVGKPDGEVSHDGTASLRIDLSPENLPVCYFDYYELHRLPIRAPLAASIGWLEVEPGKEYVFSAYLKANQAGVPARLAVRQFQAGSFEKGVTVSAEWQRFSLTFKPAARWCYVLAGPDLRKTKENQNPPERAIVWLDAVQLEKSASPTPFAPRGEIEFGAVLDGGRTVWIEQDVRGAQQTPFRPIRAMVDNRSTHWQTVRCEFRWTDFFDREVGRAEVELKVRPNSTSDWTPVAPAVSRGFYRVHARATSGNFVAERKIRYAVVPPGQAEDSRFGVNHAYPWTHLLKASSDAGLLWVRDWSLKWQDVEPERGQFDFVEPDYQVNRPIEQGMKVLGLLPFPSSNWSSSAPASVSGKGGYPQNRMRVAYAPRDPDEFENYVARTVRHYKGRIQWWQVFNEPLYTDYSLPRKLGYDGATYAQLTKAFSRAARKANPECKILAGIGALYDGQIMEDFEKFFAAGGLEAADAIDIHHYPGIRPPEFLEDLLVKLNRLMDKHGGRKPIWITEYGYYADDEPWAVPMPHEGFNRPLTSERVQAEYSLRWATIAFANGVDKIFYHAGTCGGVNGDSLQGVFYEYGGQPHKIYAAQAIMAHLFTPSCGFVKKLALGEGVHGYLFRDGKRLFAVVWSPRGNRGPIRVAGEKIRLWDVAGREQAGREFSASGTPVYLVVDGITEEEFQAALK